MSRCAAFAFVVWSNGLPNRCNPGQPKRQDHGTGHPLDGGPHGYDKAKNINGRKSHILVDTLGLLVRVSVHPANIQERDGAKMLLQPQPGN